MGQHYVPQRYLQNFEDPTRSGFVWMFGKLSEDPRQLPIASVAQASRFYDNAVENQLAIKIEGPANPVIQKLCAEQSINPDERQNLSRYIAVMLRRVPFSRQKGLEMLPAVLDETIAEIRAQVIAARVDSSADETLVNLTIAEVDAVYQKFKLEPPSNIIEQLRTPWASQEMVNLIDAMTWRVVKASGPSFFLTSDNPAFFFGAYGLKSEEAELTFPLSSFWTLHGCWQGNRGDLRFLRVNQKMVKEINRRVASTTSQFAFYNAREIWVHKLLTSPNPLLNRIIW